MNEHSLTHARLLELLTYDPETGLFVRRVSVRRWKAGSVSGSITANGYWEVAADGERYLGHRLAWFYMTGEWPPVTVDHENTVRSDNRWTNLRLATKAEQMMNTKLPSHNRSGAKGITWDEKNKKWCCEIRANRKRHWLGRFSDRQEAEAILSAKRTEIHGQFARLK